MGFRTERAEQRMAIGGLRHPEHRAKAPRIVISQCDAAIEDEVDVIVRATRWRLGERAQASGHAEVHEQCVRTQPEKQIAAAPVEPVDRATGEVFREIRGNRPP
jgi:hypothetical protein